MQTFEGAKVFADSRGKSLQTLEVITIQNFVFEVCIVITFKVFADFRFETFKLKVRISWSYLHSLGANERSICQLGVN